MKKEQLTVFVRHLNDVISSTTLENSLEKIVDFFRISSKLHDNLEKIRKLPVKRRNFLQLDPQARQRQEVFLRSVVNAGRDPYWMNRTQRGEKVTENNIFLGNIDGIWTASVAEFSKFEDDKPLKEKIQKQAFDKIKSYEGVFKVDFLR